jgi:hypothetical protein
MSTPPHSPPLVSPDQGEYRSDFPAASDSPTNATIELRFLLREPADVYHAKSGELLTSHTLSDFRRCPLLYRKKELGLVPERDTTAYLIGRAAHALILEGRQRYQREFAIGGPINPKTGQAFGSQTKAFAEWAARQSKPVLSDAQAALVEQMAASVREHGVAATLLATGVAEGVVRARYGEFPSQARIDWISPNTEIGIVDLKTCDHLDEFEAAVRAFDYVYQVAFYRALVALAGGHVLPVHIVAVEKREPFRCGVWHVLPSVLDEAQQQNEAAMAELRHCRAAGNWFTRYEKLRAIERL